MSILSERHLTNHPGEIPIYVFPKVKTYSITDWLFDVDKG